MPPRLHEIYHPGDRVEIYMKTPGGPAWRPGQVVGTEALGVWVQTRNGFTWFVTNGRRIHPAPPAQKPSTE